MIKLLAVTAAVVALVGCASGPSDYAIYAETQRQIATARSAAEIARYQALQEIASKGDSGASVAAAMGIAMGNGGGNGASQTSPIVQPRSTAEKLLPWASLLVPSLTQFYSIQQNAAIAINNSDNNLEGKKSDNGMIVDLVQGRATPIVGNRTTDPDGSESEDFLLYPR
jgi:hypothetical protein